MTSAPTTQNTALQAATAQDRPPPLRLRVKPQANTVTGFVDGGWWPRSRDLTAELPGLLAVLADRLGPIERVGYHLADWDTAVRKISVAGGVVRLEGYRSLAAGTVDVLAAQQRITLLVVPPDGSPQMAHDTLVRAGRPGNTDGVESLLASRPVNRDGVGNGRSEAEETEERWELDGGHVRGVSSPHQQHTASSTGRAPWSLCVGVVLVNIWAVGASAAPQGSDT
jgi:Family of unknown function (DUF5994)